MGTVVFGVNVLENRIIIIIITWETYFCGVTLRI